MSETKGGRKKKAANDAKANLAAAAAAAAASGAAGGGGYDPATLLCKCGIYSFIHLSQKSSVFLVNPIFNLSFSNVGQLFVSVCVCVKKAKWSSLKGEGTLALI